MPRFLPDEADSIHFLREFHWYSEFLSSTPSPVGFNRSLLERPRPRVDPEKDEKLFLDVYALLIIDL
jgi:hypothetical protein